MRVAIVDIGTNSTRMLVADVEGGAVREVERRTTVTSLGEGVDRSGRLAPAAIERVLSAIGTYRGRIDHHGAERVVALATSAARDAANRDELVGELASRHGIEMRTIAGEEEAQLTFLGATSAGAAGHSSEGPLLVVDIGGGSTELITGRAGDEPGFHVSTPLGCVRQTERHLSDDPPGPAALEALRAEARAVVEREVPVAERSSIRSGVAVAGTATSLAAVDQRLDPYDSARVDGYELGAGTCERLLEELATKPLAERREVTGLHPDRAPTIVAGVAILCETLAAFGLGAITVGERDILHGAALVVAR